MGEGFRPGAGSLDRGAHLDQALAAAAPALLSGGDPLLDRGPDLARVGEPGVDLLAGRSRLRQRGVGGFEEVVLEAQLGGDHPGPQLVLLPAEAGLALGRLGLGL